MPMKPEEQQIFHEYLAELDDAQLESVSKDYLWLSEARPEISRFSEYASKRDASPADLRAFVLTQPIGP